MAYLFAPLTTDRIECGSVPAGTTWSLYLRAALTNNDSSLRRLLRHRNNAAGTSNVLLQTDGATQTGMDAGFTSGGGAAFPISECLFGGGLDSVGARRWIVTYDQAHLLLYYEGSVVHDLPETSVPDTAGMVWCIGNIAGGGFTASAAATIYEVGWWPGTVLTPTQITTIQGGATTGVPDPTNYWGLVSDALDLFGGQHGTVTGATVVAHVGANLYSPAPPPATTVRSITVAGLG